MLSLRGKRCANVTNEKLSSDEFDDDSDSESSGKLSNHSMPMKKSKYSHSPSVTNNFQTDLAEKQQNGFHSRKRKISEESSQSGKRQKCYTKNALMARENRIKKKLHLQTLEGSLEKYKDENKKLSSILDNQSHLISDLRKEVKYLKNVLANSTDIGRLLKCINQNTGMQTTTSIDAKVHLSAPDRVLHPWAENETFNLNGELATSDWCNFETDLFSDIYSTSLMTNDVNVDVNDLNAKIPQADFCNEHNYTKEDSSFDAGVCLHIAKHKVSLEFCSSCSENASSTWKKN